MRPARICMGALRVDKNPHTKNYEDFCGSKNDLYPVMRTHFNRDSLLFFTRHYITV